MNLKRRLVIINVIAVIIPVIITALFAFTYLYLSSKISGTKVSFANYQQLSQIKNEIMVELDGVNQNREKIDDPAFQNYLVNRLNNIEGELIIVKGTEMIFSTSPNISKIDVAKLLELHKEKAFSKTTYKIGSTSYTVEVIELGLKDGSSRTLILLAPVAYVFNLNLFIISVVICFILSAALTSFLLSYHLSRHILEPINNLQKAAEEISKGDLTFEIVEEGDREIQELCRDMELMRIKLKELIHNQMKYEENRKALISSISHDLKTPVTSIKGYVEGIIDGVANTPEKMERYLKTIYVKAHQIDKMIDDLLLYAKLDLNQIPFNFEKTDMGTYFYECFLENEPELENCGIKTVFINELKKARCALIDREKMKRVITNIVDNSRKYMNRTDGEIQFIIRETPVSIILEIKDNGEGIKEKDLPHIFDRFYRSDQARSETKGSGLGLAIAKQIIEGHQGKIWATSEKGKGMSVLISLKKLS